jgi:hypothetical protein
MKTFSYYVTYHLEDSGEIDAEDYEEAQRALEEQMYAVSQTGGYSIGWDYVEYHDLTEIADDGEDDEDA